MGPQEPQQPQQAPVQPVMPQPQDVQQPQQFPQTQVPPVQPTGMAPYTSTPAPKKGLSKGALWGIIGGGVGLVLVIVGVVLALTLFGGPTKADYSKAGDKVSEANSAYNNMSSNAYDLTSSSSTDTSRKNARESMQESADKFNAAFEEAGKMKGISGDKEVKEKYDAVEAKRTLFNSYLEKLLEISEKFTPVYSDFGNLSSSSTTSQLSAARKSLEDIGTLKDDATNTFIVASITYLKSLEDYKKYRDAYTAGGTYDATAFTKYSSAYDTYADAAKDWQSSLTKTADEAELKDDLNALANTLITKITGD